MFFKIMKKLKINIVKNDKVRMYKKFDDIRISTQTVVIMTNIQIHKLNIYNLLPVIDLDIPLKLKPKEAEQLIIQHPFIKNGSIVTLEYIDGVRGYKLIKKKIKKKTSKRQGYFHNNVTIVMYIEGKLINFKVPSVGKIQMTGCRKSEHAEMCMKYLYEYLLQCKQMTDLETFHFTDDKPYFYAIFKTVMTNINFNIGFHINRESLDRYLNTNTNFNSLLEPNFSYTGVNINRYFTHRNTKIPMLIYQNDQWVHLFIYYEDYLQLLSKTDLTKELSKRRKNNFFVFYNGTAIMSGMDTEYMRDVYEDFMTIVMNGREYIQEKE